MEPFLAWFPPGLIAAEVHPPLAHGVAWPELGSPWLLHKMMRVHSVDTRAKSLVSNGLEPSRMFIPTSQVGSSREGFGANDALVERMRAGNNGIGRNRTPLVFATPEFHVWMVKEFDNLFDFPRAGVGLGHELHTSFVT